MEYVEEEIRQRQRFQLQSSSAISSSNSAPPIIGKAHIALCSACSLILLLLAYTFTGDSFLSLFIVWVAVSLLIGPFAPLPLTGGDITVGKGEILPDDDEDDGDAAPEEATVDRKKSARQRRPPVAPPPLAPIPLKSSVADEKEHHVDREEESTMEEEEEEWTADDLKLLKKLVTKNPVGMPGRWELIAETFRGRHRRESVISAAKSLATVRPGADGDSLTAFLRQRKKDEEDRTAKIVESAWSGAEDVALLNALKAFPKDTPMRWEKIAQAVPGKSKASCMRRFSELKRDFRSSKEAS